MPAASSGIQLHCAKNSDTQPQIYPGKKMTVDHTAREAENAQQPSFSTHTPNP